MSKPPAHPLTVDQLEDGHALLLGTTGSGKTYQLRGLLEQLRRADRRVGAVDKLGNHWGLTLSADGTSRGLDFVIFGGKRPGCVPMTPLDGARIGRLFVERNIPAIFDVSQWHADEQQQWVADFADAVFRHNQGALHLSFDEVQSWAPQSGGGDAFRAVQRLAEQGRGNGLRLLMSCQRLSRLDATVRGMAHWVLAMRTTLVLDRKAVRDLVASSAEDVALLERELPTLPAGTGFLWDPLTAGLKRVSFPANETFDSSRAPRHGDTPPAPIASSSALVEELRQLLAPRKAGKPESQNSGYPDDSIPVDPAAAYEKGHEIGTMLRERDERIAELEAKLADLQAEVEHLRGVDAECDRYQEGLGELEQLLADIRSGRRNMHSSSADMHSGDAELHEKADASKAAPAPFTAERGTAVTAGVPPRQREILDWLHWSTVMFGDGPVRRDLLAQLLGRHVRTKGFLNDLGELRTAGLIDYAAGGGVALTQTGLPLARKTPTPATPVGLREQLAKILTPAQRNQFARVVEIWPEAISREDLAAAVGHHVRTKSFLNNLGRLHSLGFVTYPAAGGVRAADFLMRWRR